MCDRRLWTRQAVGHYRQAKAHTHHPHNTHYYTPPHHHCAYTRPQWTSLPLTSSRRISTAAAVFRASPFTRSSSYLTSTTLPSHDATFVWFTTRSLLGKWTRLSSTFAGGYPKPVPPGSVPLTTTAYPAHTTHTTGRPLVTSPVSSVPIPPLAGVQTPSPPSAPTPSVTPLPHSVVSLGAIDDYSLPEAQEDIHNLPLESILKVFSHTTSPNYFLPWQNKPSAEKTGSGFILPGRRIITNAHVIADYSFITVKKFGGTQKFAAQVLGVGHDCDLALLTVADDEFWETVEPAPLEMGDIPHLQDTVAVVGYPSGGENISVTRGVVSRIEPQQYAHASGHMLAIQIDAAINPGNSGGPVLKDNKVIGVAFQSLLGAENIGFIIPIPIVNHFLKDLERHGKYTGFGGMGIQCQPLENMQLRKFLATPPETTGVMINHVEKVSGSYGILQKDDVIFSIDGEKVANDGTIAFRKRERIFFDHVLSKKFIGDTVRLGIWRQGQTLDLEVKVTPLQPIVPVHRFDEQPSYFIHAGLVFTPLTQPYLMEYGEEWYNNSPRKLCIKAFSEYTQIPGQEVVVLSNVLVHQVNDGYQQMVNQQLLKFNAQSVLNLRQLRDYIRNNTEPYLRFDFEDNSVIILSADAAKEAQEAILKAHRIPAAESPDLLVSEEPAQVVPPHVVTAPAPHSTTITARDTQA
eukprot:TRINITY_DN5288_c0_g1_i2.p1 TRINITY_DN5288_c0_g1~~TRINITY_DN5288_c0_g1_i2.p1  ORF type:complete len:689 (-),score=98.87 TRINITY_DN5288_c0_g1_i2:55-2121(-)